MQHPADEEKPVDFTPWAKLAVTVVDTQVEGEAGLIGRRNRPVLEYCLDIGLRIEIEKQVAWPVNVTDDEVGDDCFKFWYGTIQIWQFQPQTGNPTLELDLEADVPDAEGKEVRWYFREGMGCRYVGHALARWRAAAQLKWLGEKVELKAADDPHLNPQVPPCSPPFHVDLPHHAFDDFSEVTPPAIHRPEQHRFSPALGATGSGRLGAAGKVAPGSTMEQGLSQALGELAPRGSLPGSSLTKDGGIFPLPKEQASLIKKSLENYVHLTDEELAVEAPPANPQWFNELLDKKGAITKLDLLEMQACRKSNHPGSLSGGADGCAKARELGEAIAKGDAMQVLAKLDAQSANAQVPETGHTAAHACVAAGSADLLRVVLKAQADVNIKDNSGHTPFTLADRRGREDLAKLLVATGATTPLAGSERDRDRKPAADERASELGARSAKVHPPSARAEAAARDRLDYSRWDKLHRDMMEEELHEQRVRCKELAEASGTHRQESLKLEDFGPTAFGLPADTPWPPADPATTNKGDFDYSRWDHIADFADKKFDADERFEHLQRNPVYEYRDGEKFRVIF